MIEETIQKFRLLWGLAPTGTLKYQKGKEIEDFLREALIQERKDTANEILIFLDKLEIEQPQDLKTDNWRNWKYIRNSIVDKYNLLEQRQRIKI
jgi:hypothetical protein